MKRRTSDPTDRIRQIDVLDRTVFYRVRESSRARRLRLSLDANGALVMTVPRRCPWTEAERFLQRHTTWIARHAPRIKTPLALNEERELDRNLFERHKREARLFVVARLEEINRAYGFSYLRISIRRSRTRWGSCSSRGTLSFHYTILRLPEALQDYLLVHELCHLKEMNHGPRFWQLVSRVVPDYPARRRRLQTFHLATLTADRFSYRLQVRRIT